MANQTQNELVLLKLGGSLITDKHAASRALPEVIDRLAGEIAAARAELPALHLILGHGSGSFGHMAAQTHHTRQGVHTAQEWAGFAEVWRQASALNRIVIESLHKAGLPAIAFPPSAGCLAGEGIIRSWDLEPLKAALAQNLLPVVFGDVGFDLKRGGTILSTEDVFGYLAGELHPRRILLAGIETGVWADHPACTRLLKEITPQTLPEALPGLGGSEAPDVTGGMEGKVHQMLALVQQHPELEVFIFSGGVEGVVRQALGGKAAGTRIRA